MSISYLTESQLSADLTANGNLDAAVRDDVLAALQTDGTYNPANPNQTAWVQQGAYVPPSVNFVNVVDITTDGTEYINTDAAMQAIVLQSPDPTQIYLTDDGTHHNNVYVALGTGNDSVNLYDGGNDTVQAGSGDDVIGGGTGNDLLLGGTGNDSIFGGSGANTMIGGSGNDYIRVAGAHQLAEGGSGNNVIVDLGGYTGAGTSTLQSGTGNDTIYGYGSDTVQSSMNSPGHSELHGGTDGDVISYSAANSYNILGSGSTDSTNANTLQGGAGADSLYGGGGQDTLIAGSGNQFLDAGVGAHQSLMGGSGNDLLQDLQSGGTDTLTAGAGSGTQTLVGQQGDLFNSAAGSTGNDVFWVDAGNGAGSTLIGGSGNDTFHIETHIGNDTIIGGTGDNAVGFAGRSASDISNLTDNNGTWTLTFNDGQKITMSGVSELYFGTDHQVINLPPH
jgi:Ca2+-binding RTX toxin-like protein